MPNKNTHWLLKNLRGTSHLRCGCRTWLDHYYQETRSARTLCPVVACGEPVEVGAHVIDVDGRASRQRWIVPFCKRHNASRDVLWVSKRVDLVSANTQIMRCYVR